MKIIKVSDSIYINPDAVKYVHFRPSTFDKGTYFYDVYINVGACPELAVAEKLSLDEAKTILQNTLGKLTAQED